MWCSGVLLTCDHNFGLDGGQVFGHQPEHRSILRLLERKQRLHVLDQCPLHGRVPGLGHASRHGSDGVPVLVDVRNNLLVSAECEAHTPVLNAGLLHVRDGGHAHLGYGWRTAMMMSVRV